MSVFTVSAVQFNARLYAPDVNRSAVEEAVRAEAAAGASLIVLPELAVSGYGVDPEGLDLSSELADGPTGRLLSTLAQGLDVVIVCGFCERGEDGALYNSAMLVAPGREQVVYRKLHLFDAEKEVFSPGNLGLVCADTELGRIGLCVCYDLRFVEVARGLSLAGADVLAVPTAWVGGFDKSDGDATGMIGQVLGVLVQANLDQLPMVCASQSGGDQGTRFLGSSVIADAFGNAVAGPMGKDEIGAIRAEMDLERIHAARIRSARVQPRADRRTDVYALSLGGQSY